jgi:hypothetical protein
VNDETQNYRGQSF